MKYYYFIDTSNILYYITKTCTPLYNNQKEDQRLILSKGDITMIWLAITIFILISFILICANAIAKRSDEKMEEIMEKERNKEK